MPFHSPITDEAALTVGENPSPFGFLNRTPNNVWGDIQSNEAPNPFAVDNIINDYFGTSVNPHMPPLEGFQGQEGELKYVEGMGFPAPEGYPLVDVGDYNLDWENYFNKAEEEFWKDGDWTPMVQKGWYPSYRDNALVNVDAAESTREMISAFKNDTGKTFELESAFRTPFHNFAVDGEPRTEFSEGSKHMQGFSIDVTDKKSLLG